MNDWHLPTYQENLAIFVGELRDKLFSSQEETAAYFCLDRGQISRYESGKSTPKLGYLAGLAQLMAKRSDNDPQIQARLLQEVNRAIKRHYRKGKFQDWPALSKAADGYLLAQRDRQAKKASPQDAPIKEGWQATLEQRTHLPPPVELIGTKGPLKQLSDVLTTPEAPWVIAIDGLGGIGKTALANRLVRQSDLSDRFHDMAWISAKQQTFLTSHGIEQTSAPALTAEVLTDALLEQLHSDIPLTQTLQQKQIALTQLLKPAPFLIVIDNLETITDYQALLPSLQKLANPSKFLLTTRHSLRTYADVFCLSLEELSQSDTLRFIRQEAKIKGVSMAAQAPKRDLTSIYNVVGGNPLALKLVVGQISVLSLSEVLDNLKHAKGKKIEDLFTYIYWQAWEMLDEASQKTLLMMPLTQNGTIQQLTALTELERNVLNQALQQLAQLSLLQIGGTLKERRYTIHRLTETFILNETIEWKTSG